VVSVSGECESVSAACVGRMCPFCGRVEVIKTIEKGGGVKPQAYPQKQSTFTIVTLLFESDTSQTRSAVLGVLNIWK
jgi:hypothetical protein